MNENKKSLLGRLTEYHKTAIPMHMPGHKRNSALLGAALPYEIDITEIDGFDNLHDMNGVLKETASLAVSLYGSKEAFPLVGGSTCGILAAVRALAPFGSHVLIARSSHKSVFHAAELMGLYPHYISPETDAFGICGKITPEAVDRALREGQNIALVIVTSPTYEGVISDISSISEVCRKHGALLLVDAAHGAHLGLAPHFLQNAALQCYEAPHSAAALQSAVAPQSAVAHGADVVVMSLHKTMPALTQTALLHICSDAVDPNKICEALSVFETSSPSYPLLASIDACLRLISDNGEQLFQNFSENLTAFYEETKTLKALRVVRYDDPGKLVVSAKNTALTGTDLAQILRTEFKIEVEMAGKDYILAIASICDSKETLLQFAGALKQIDADLPGITGSAVQINTPLPEMKETPFAAHQKTGEFVPLKDAVGRECLEYVWAYPPGIPLIVPGEIIGCNMINAIKHFACAKIQLKSTKKGLADGKIWVSKN